MQSSRNYLWLLGDILGQGATASVYKARHKRSGDPFAVKVFNKVSYLRPHDVQMREFEVLRKLSHKNIVKLFAVEEVGGTKQKVLVMEYCAGGSLLNLLEESENAFGLSEPEFLNVLQSIVAGMNQLREQGVIHRDIKPGNIMRVLEEDGRSQYKLTDFGAARELEDDEKFMSLYGTEEYLHPDMYERAVLRKPQSKAYGATVDLWSIGVTLYHTGTGRLPFIPYGGPRRNKEMMYKITTEKPPGAISGVQGSELGAVEWSSELPASCQLSQGLKSLLETVLANILEAAEDRCWGFDRFFSEANDILRRLVVHVVSLPHGTEHSLYLPPHSTVAELLAGMCRQTGLVGGEQELLCEGRRLRLDPDTPVHNLPRTSEAEPLVLVSTEPPGPPTSACHEPEIPTFPPKFDVVGDASLAKAVISAVHQLLKIGQRLTRCHTITQRGVYWLTEILMEECHRAAQEMELICLRLSFLQREVLWLLTTWECLPQTHQELQVAAAHELHRKIELGLDFLGNELLPIKGNQEQLRALRAELVRSSESQPNSNVVAKIQVLLQKISAIYTQFKRNRIKMRLQYNEEQIHKFDKVKMGIYAKKVQALFREDCVQARHRSLLVTGNRLRTLCEIWKRLRGTDEQRVSLSQQADIYQAQLNKMLAAAGAGVPSLSCTGGDTQTVSSSPASVHLADRKCVEMTSRMKQLKQEMETVTLELQQNNIIIQRIGELTKAADV
uniref:Inhibitor of nuclear factor kappa-B kinase subunit epsilon-like protein n=1 Tax=Callorhinchus milii TaxID=7868 RepID=V9KHY5_CALMI